MPRPPEALLAALHDQLKDYPEHGPGTFRYPSPRKRKAGQEVGGPFGELPPPPPPLKAGGGPVRLITLSVSAGVANRRNTSSSNRLLGPAILRTLAWWTNTGADPPNMSLDVGYAEAPVLEVNVPTGDSRAWTSIVDHIRDPRSPSDTTPPGLPMWTVPASSNREAMRLDLPIPRVEFYLVLSLDGVNVGVGGRVIAYAMVEEGFGVA